MPEPHLLQNLRRAMEIPATGSSDFDLNPDVVLPANRKLRPAAVLLALEQNGDRISVILTKRSSALKHHAGQIALPGGKVDETDADATQTALREAHEEIGLHPKTVSVIGVLPEHETVTGFNVTPVVALVSGEFVAQPEPGEVAEVFRVPLEFVTNPANFQIQSRRWQGAPRYYYTVVYGPYYIWGATATILHRLAKRLTP